MPRPLSWPDFAGLVSWSRARSTGTHVGVYQSQEAGIEEDVTAGRWATVCEPHAGVVLHETRQVAMQWAPHPEAWCPTCQDEKPPPDCPHDARECGHRDP